MAIKVLLQDIGGGVIDRELDPDRLLQQVLPIADESFPLLQYVDPYGSTVFNGLQMVQLLKELDKLSSKISEGAGALLLSKIKVLAERCRGNPQTYLRFVGD